MQRSKFFIISLFNMLLLFASCDKTLVESPESIIAPNAFFKTADQCQQATFGVYSHLPVIFNQTAFWSVTMGATDIFMFNGGNLNVKALQDYSFSASTEVTSQTVWGSCYAAIKNANFVISRVSTSSIDDGIKNQLLGESKFLRALYYYILSNTFGDVPLWTNELEVDKISNLPRSPLKDVRDQIVQDLKEAVASLPLSYPNTQTGRVTKGAALTLLAKVYLFNKDWKNAYDAALQVKSGGQYLLLPNYADVFDPLNKNKNNKESIFEIQYMRNAATNQNFITNAFYGWFFPLGDAAGGTYTGVNFGTTLLQSYPGFYPSQLLVDLYKPEDTRRNVSLAWGYNGQTFNKGPVTGRPWFGPKFWDLTANRTFSEKNLYFLRYADIIMILAEASNELVNSEAFTYLNMIQKRAGLPDLDNNLNQEQLRNFIMDERAREFVGEFQRKWDLGRWNKLVDAIQSISNENVEGAKNVKSYHSLFPIPYDEIVKNRNLTQNKGYQ